MKVWWDLPVYFFAATNTQGEERRLCWVVRSHRACQSQRQRTAKCRRSIILSKRLAWRDEKTATEISQRKCRMPGSRERVRSELEKCFLPLSELQRTGNSPVMGMSKKKTRHRWEQESALNTFQAQRGQHWAHDSIGWENTFLTNVIFSPSFYPGGVRNHS